MSRKGGRISGGWPYLLHTNCELGLMLKGAKPLAAFSHDGELAVLDRYLRFFDRYVTKGSLIKRERFVIEPVAYRQIFYALPGEEWRIDALIELRSSPFWGDVQERREGELLGYETWQNDYWIEHRHTSRSVLAIEASLLELRYREAAMRELLFDRFFAIFPHRREIFIHVATSSVRMTSETLQWMHGLAQGKKWVWSQVAELVFNHRNYGELTQPEFDCFIDLTIDTLRDTIDRWDMRTEASWREQGEALKVLVQRAREEWAASPLAYP